MDPHDPTIHGVRYRAAKRCARRRALLVSFGRPAEPVQDLDRTTAGIQDTGVELGLGPKPVSVDRSIGDGRRRGRADQDDADGKGEGSHERTISGSDVRRNRRTGSGSASVPSHPERTEGRHDEAQQPELLRGGRTLSAPDHDRRIGAQGSMSSLLISPSRSAK
jgi:hypothetical protein